MAMPISTSRARLQAANDLAMSWLLSPSSAGGTAYFGGSSLA